MESTSKVSFSEEVSWHHSVHEGDDDFDYVESSSDASTSADEDCERLEAIVGAVYNAPYLPKAPSTMLKGSLFSY